MLTPREKQVMRCVGKGLNDLAIGDKLGMSEGTVLTHKKHVREKLKIHNNSALVSLAMRYHKGGKF